MQDFRGMILLHEDDTLVQAKNAQQIANQIQMSRDNPSFRKYIVGSEFLEENKNRDGQCPFEAVFIPHDNVEVAQSLEGDYLIALTREEDAKYGATLMSMFPGSQKMVDDHGTH